MTLPGIVRSVRSATLARLTAPATRVPVTRRVAYGLAFAAFCVAATLSAPAGRAVREVDPLGIGLLVVPAMAAGWVTVTTRSVLAITTAAMVAFYALGYGSIFAPAPVTVAVFTAVLLGRGRYAAAAVFAAAAGALAAGLAHGLPPVHAATGPGWIIAWTVAAAAAGAVLRQRRALLEHERHRAEEAARHGAERERLRIARELHDTLTHSISVINVQASVAAHLADREPERVPDALGVIRAVSGDALHELRATVEVLRRVDTGVVAADEPADEPGPSLERLPELAERTRAAGADVELRLAPGERLPPRADRAVYRIVQESLANAVRHAPGACVRVTVERDDRVVRVTVRNGPPRGEPERPGGGAGLTGMRERAGALGGRLTAGPDGDGFAVHAALPLAGPGEERP